MKRFFVSFAVVLTMTTFSFGQKTDELLEEGKLLYRLEKASWYGSDFFYEHFQHKREIVGGYLSYLNENNQVINIFFEKDNPSRILVRFEFDSLPQTNPIIIDTINTMATEQEIELITIRQDAIQKISENKNRFFRFYENTSYNFIPLIRNEIKQVFILTSTQVPNIIIIGNDYLLTYNSENNLIKREKLHKSILKFPGKSGNPENPIVSTYHIHVLSELITSTDICTLLLYKDFIEWKQHYVFGKKSVSVFDLEKEELIVSTNKEWNKTNRFERNKQ